MTPTIHDSLKALFSAFPSADSADPEYAALAYLMAVEGESESAVAEAVRRFIRGEVKRGEEKRGRHTFLPSTAELAIEVRARAEMIAVCARAASRQALASPKLNALSAPVSPEIKAKVGEMMRDLTSKISRGQQRQRPDAEQERGSGDAPTISTAPVKASRSLLASLGLDQDNAQHTQCKLWSGQ